MDFCIVNGLTRRRISQGDNQGSLFDSRSTMRGALPSSAILVTNLVVVFGIALCLIVGAWQGVMDIDLDENG